MKSLMSVALALSATALFHAAPALAQEQGGDKVNQLIIYGDDPCPQSTGDEITVCARKSEGERYRIPEPLRDTDRPGNESWTQRVLAYETVGATGINSCSPAGAGGEYGCTQKLINAAYAERKQSSDVKFGQMISEARKDRLSTIDQETADEQSRVEQLEKEFYEREAAERAAGTGDPVPPVDGNAAGSGK
jgi:hypothetical protein